MEAPAAVERLAAFTDDPDGGNPAGVVLAEWFPDDAEMLRIAAEVGYSETAFLVPATGRSFDVRYFAPEAEVPFCGHATIAAGVLLGQREGPGRYRFATAAGDVPVEVTLDEGRIEASLTSVEPRHRSIAGIDLDVALEMFGWDRSDLDPDLPPAEAYAGAWHLVLALADRDVLGNMSYDFAALRGWMHDRDLTTIQVVHRRDATSFDARDPFPVGGVVEDPATGAAAAALGGYLRGAGLVRPPAGFTIHQGRDMGRPSRITVNVPVEGGVRVSGTAVRIPD